MRVSIDISMYPLNQDYIQPIQSFINSLKKYSEIEISENKMTTQVFGEYDATMEIVQREIKNSGMVDNKVVFTLKVIPFDVNN